MSLFNWYPSDGSSPQVSPYIWIYWTISVPLTVITLLIWRLWWKIENAKYDYQIAKAKQEYGRRNPPLKMSDGQGDVGNGSTSVSDVALGEGTTAGILLKYFHELVDDLWRRTSRLFCRSTRRNSDPQIE